MKTLLEKSKQNQRNKKPQGLFKTQFKKKWGDWTNERKWTQRPGPYNKSSRVIENKDSYWKWTIECQYTILEFKKPPSKVEMENEFWNIIQEYILKIKQFKPHSA